MFFYGGEGGIWTLDTLLGYTRFPIVRARPATRLLQVCCSGQPSYITPFSLICQDLFSNFYKNLYLHHRRKLLTTYWNPDIILWLYEIASVAQSVVHLTRNEKVACSSHVTSSKKESSYTGWLFSFCWNIFKTKYPIPTGIGYFIIH